MPEDSQNPRYEALRGSVLRYDDPYASVFPESPEVVRIETAQIVDWDSFHAIFAQAMAFPDFYGRNMNAWIDCMSDLRIDSRMTRFRLENGQVLLIELVGATDFRKRLPEIHDALIEAVAFTNRRYRDDGTGPAIALMPVQ